MSPDYLERPWILDECRVLAGAPCRSLSLWTRYIWGHVQMTSVLRGRKLSQFLTKGLEVGWSLTINSDRGKEVKNFKEWADVICAWPPFLQCDPIFLFVSLFSVYDFSPLQHCLLGIIYPQWDQHDGITILRYMWGQWKYWNVNTLAFQILIIRFSTDSRPPSPEFYIPCVRPEFRAGNQRPSTRSFFIRDIVTWRLDLSLKNVLI